MGNNALVESSDATAVIISTSHPKQSTSQHSRALEQCLIFPLLQMTLLPAYGEQRNSYTNAAADLRNDSNSRHDRN